MVRKVRIIMDAPMLPFGILLASTAFGVAGMPWWSAAGCGLMLAVVAASERTELSARATRLGRADVLSLAGGASLLIAQAASIGTFAAGRLIGGLLV